MDVVTIELDGDDEYPAMPIDQLLGEIHTSVQSGSWVLALMGALALPDICAALEDPDGRTSGAKYRAWVDAYLGDQYPSLDAEQLYQMRCGMLHQARSDAGPALPRVHFLASETLVFHQSLHERDYYLDLRVFVADLLNAVLDWKREKANDPLVQRNNERFVQWRPVPPGLTSQPGTVLS